MMYTLTATPEELSKIARDLKAVVVEARDLKEKTLEAGEDFQTAESATSAILGGFLAEIFTEGHFGIVSGSLEELIDLANTRSEYIEAVLEAADGTEETLSINYKGSI